MPKLRGSRFASHGGSWYESDPKTLASQIQEWMEDAEITDTHGHTRAVIAPHAGYRYCGHVMAYAYKYINPNLVKRIFLLGPSHHFYSPQCHLSQYKDYSTPLGNATIDADIYAQLEKSGKFPPMSNSSDEDEHSLELHMPYIMAAMKGKPFTLVPILVGATSKSAEAEYGSLLAPYLADPGNFFVISSDFCHWGSRFNYTFYQNEHGAIHTSIEWLDKKGMDIIETGDPRDFSAYLEHYGNTICGRHPIAVLLHALEQSNIPHRIHFTKYDQSNRCTSQRDSSVSYASAIVVLERGGVDGST